MMDFRDKRESNEYSLVSRSMWPEAVHTDLELFIHLVNDGLIEVEGILLVADVDRLTPQAEHLPEDLWLVELQLALQQVTKYLLDLAEHTATTTTRFKGVTHLEEHTATTHSMCVTPSQIHYNNML